ncbi:MAG: hypothetical protein ACLQLC_03075 [Candidatus Sulfotelmatobacter sp.]
MQIEQVNLREKLDQARLSFDTELADVLRGRLDLTHAQIKKKFGVSETVIRRVIRQFNIGARRRGPKRRKHQFIG